jgi:competence protein ComEC
MRRYLFQPIHISWHIAAISAGVLLGVALLSLELSFVELSGVVWLAASGGFCLVACVRRLRILLMASLFAGICLGIWRGGLDRRALMDYLPYYGQVVRLSGTIREDTALGKHGEMQLQLTGARIDQRGFHGKVWASVASGASIKRGDTVYIKGVLEQGFGSMAASMFRAQLERVEHPYPGDVARRFRDWFADAVRHGIPEPQGSLGIGFLTGQHSALPSVLEEQLRVAGLTHIVVASGYNLTVLVGFVRRVFAGVSKYLSVLCSTLLIAGFVAIAGMGASMSRAGLVAALSLAAWYWGRTIHPLVLLPFAACVTVLVDPAFVWGDIGWYLSFLAFAGVIVLAPLMRRYLWPKNKDTGVIKQIMFDTLSAQLFTLPLILFVFGTFSTYALLANLLVLPLVPLAMLLTFLTGLIGLVVPGIIGVAGLPAQWLLSYMTSAVQWVAELPHADEKVTFSVPMLVGGYVLLVALCLVLRRMTQYDFRESD